MLVVPETAVRYDANGAAVMVVGADDKAVYREVRLGAPVNGLRIVTAGLSPGERIVVNGLQRVRPGMPVKPRLVPMQGEPAGP